MRKPFLARATNSQDLTACEAEAITLLAYGLERFVGHTAPAAREFASAFRDALWSGDLHQV